MSAALFRGPGSSDAIRAFFDRWHVYELLIRHDYMSHRGIHRALRVALEKSRTSPFSVMDLGCGDSSVVAQTLSGLPVNRYVGVDLSEIALDMAGERLKDASFPLELVAGDLSDHLALGGTEAVDVIIAGFAVHHLDDDEKARFFADCARKLNAGGDLYLFDVFRREGQSREEYMAAYCGWLEGTWFDIPKERRIEIAEHIREYDFPVDFETMSRLASSAGFDVPDGPDFIDRIGFHRLYRFRSA